MSVSIQDLNVAIEWLMNNEGDEDSEQASCLKVAEFLKKELAKREVGQIARQHGVSNKVAKMALEKIRGVA